MTAPTVAVVHQLSDTVLLDPVDAASDAVNGNSFVNTGRTLIRFKNSGGSSATVVFAPLTAAIGPEQFAVTGETKTFAAAAVGWIGQRDLASFGRNCVFKTSASTLDFTIFEP